jgi:ABC-type multidrug transport system ATPase subunit
LKALTSIYGSQQEFFKALESTYISQLLSEVRIKIKVRNADNSLTFRELSEGEQQLLMVLGLLRFTKEDEALFLLDEPDTHLNPVWSIQYLEFLREIVGPDKSSHVIMSTHNPLVISSLERSQVRVMQRDDETGLVTVETPEESPRGMGIAGILTSDIFGLRSALDLPTQKLMDERRELAVKEVLTEEDKARLGKLNEELQDLDFSISARDTLYTRFVEEMTRRQPPEIKQAVALTPEQQHEQRKLIRQILDEITLEEQEPS